MRRVNSFTLLAVILVFFGYSPDFSSNQKAVIEMEPATIFLDADDGNVMDDLYDIVRALISE